MPVIKYKSGFTPHARQRELLDCTARFIICACGRRFGKTLAGMEKLARAACADIGGEQSLYWWAAPTYRRSSKAFDVFERVLRPIIRFARRTDFTIVLINDVRIEFVSLDKWENLKGDALKGIVIDEAARCPQRAWTELIRPSLTDFKGWALLISTPLGRNWFYYLYLKGDHVNSKLPDKDTQSFKFPTSDNPYIDPQEICNAQHSLPEDVYKQEFLAEFLEEGAGVFKGLSLCKPSERELQQGLARLRPSAFDEVSTLGVDLGKHQDYTVLINLTSAPHYTRRYLTFFERMTKVDWIPQQAEIIQVARANRAIVWIDSTGPGDRIYEDLIRAGIRAEGFKFSSPVNRESLLKTLQVEIANGRICLPEQPVDIMAPLWEELQDFEYKITPGGKLSMGPPDGTHDDCVMSLGLAVMGSIRNTSILDLSGYAAERQAKLQQEVAQNNPQVLNVLGLPGTGVPFSFFGAQCPSMPSPFQQDIRFLDS